MKTNGIKEFLFLLILLSFFSFTVRGQAIARQSIGSYGAGGSIEGAAFSQTVGQPYSTGIYADNVVGINPGFQQSGLLLNQTKGKEEQKEKTATNKDYKDLKVYPNPASSDLYIDTHMEQGDLKIFDMQGRKILDKRITDPYSYPVNCSDWNSGLYMIKVYDKSTDTHYRAKVLISK
ncbi:MAG: T9SS type A sorting domain-containing protein [Bacteroidales bacterium]|nr:T9SS type A sorting domain-containing protein [Bacteroidales bacterium]